MDHFFVLSKHFRIFAEVKFRSFADALFADAPTNYLRDLNEVDDSE